MTIYVDVTEARAASRLHPKLAQSAHKIVGLEQATGADILVTTIDDVLPGNVNRPPGSLLLKRHVENGMLIQRKTGSDAMNSIPRFHNLIARMRAANSKMAWLLVTGYIFRKPENNKVMVEGRLTEWNWKAYQAALDAWQILGGYTHVEPDDLTAVDWVIAWDEKLPQLVKDLEKGLAERPMTPKLGLIDPHPERQVLMGFPGCGDAISSRIMEKCQNLAAALEWMSRPDSYGVPGVGEETLKSWRKYMGLEKGEVINRIKVESEEENVEQRGTETGVAKAKRVHDFDGSTTIPNRPERPTRDNRYKDE